MAASWEPDLTTDPTLRGVLEELRAREPILHRPELGTTREALEQQVATDFWEVGPTGDRYSRELVLSTLLERHAKGEVGEWETSEFQCREAGADTYLLTYTLRKGDRLTRRLTVWRRSDDGWQIVFHQGTLVEEQPT